MLNYEEWFDKNEELCEMVWSEMSSEEQEYLDTLDIASDMYDWYLYRYNI